MILIIAGVLIIGITIGLVWERYSWVRACKNRKVKAVDGNLYAIRETKPIINEG